MMKKVFMIVFSVFALLTDLKAQDTVKLNIPYDETGKKILYSLVQTSTLKEGQMFTNAQTWLANNVGSYKAAVQLEDKTAGKIIAKCSLNDQSNVYKFFFTLSIDVKDEKYRIQLYDITHLTDHGIEPYENNITSNFRHSKGKARTRVIKSFNRHDELFRTVLLSLKTAIEKKDEF